MARQPKRGAEGAPVGRRALLGILGAGAAGLVAAPALQRRWEEVLGAASQADLLAWALAAALLGHVRKAFEDPETLQGMRTGYVSPAWVARHHPRWPGEERDENE